MTTTPRSSKRRARVTASVPRPPLRRTVAHRTIDSSELAERIADGESCASIARDFRVAASTVSRQARLPDVVEEVERIIEHRARLVVRLRVSHAAASSMPPRRQPEACGVRTRRNWSSSGTSSSGTSLAGPLSPQRRSTCMSARISGRRYRRSSAYPGRRMNSGPRPPNCAGTSAGLCTSP